jgi:hypothetical protein
MSEYQWYEFVALERPLTAKQMAELRAISTRAEISPTRFWNEYEWGDLKADPAKLLARYFDAHWYFASWGTHRIMLRLPKARVDLKALKPYFFGKGPARLAQVGDHVVLDLLSDGEELEDDDRDDEPPGRGALAALSPLRAELMRGDLRPAYLAWLLAVQLGNVDDEAREPPVPAGLAELTAAQQAMVELLRLDEDLIAAAASESRAVTADGAPFRRWLAALPAKQKDAWLSRAADEPDLALGGELLRAFREAARDGRSDARRSIGELRGLAEAQRARRETAAAARAKKASAASAAARQRHLTKLGRDAEGAWAKLEKLIETSRYAEALPLAVDLRELAARDGTSEAFARRFEAMRKRQLRRRGFFGQWKHATRAR